MKDLLISAKHCAQLGDQRSKEREQMREGAPRKLEGVVQTTPRKGKGSEPTGEAAREGVMCRPASDLERLGWDALE